MLQLALRESAHLGHPCSGTEHLLLGLLREGEGVGAQVIVAAGVPLDQLRDSVLTLLGR